MFPMLEMAHGRVKFIDKITYIYNQDNPLNDYKNKIHEVIHCERVIRSKAPYDPLAVQEVQQFVAAQTPRSFRYKLINYPEGFVGRNTNEFIKSNLITPFQLIIFIRSYNFQHILLGHIASIKICNNSF